MKQAFLSSLSELTSVSSITSKDLDNLQMAILSASWPLLENARIEAREEEELQKEISDIHVDEYTDDNLEEKQNQHKSKKKNSGGKSKKALSQTKENESSSHDLSTVNHSASKTEESQEMGTSPSLQQTKQTSNHSELEDDDANSTTPPNSLPNETSTSLQKAEVSLVSPDTHSPSTSVESENMVTHPRRSARLKELNEGKDTGSAGRTGKVDPITVHEAGNGEFTNLSNSPPPSPSHSH